MKSLLALTLILLTLTCSGAENYEKCCEMKKEDLEAMIFGNRQCRDVPDQPMIRISSDPCSPCPTDTCQLFTSNDNRHKCMCPRAFLEDEQFHYYCEAHYDKKYPKSIGRENRFMNKACSPTPSSSPLPTPSEKPEKTCPRKRGWCTWPRWKRIVVIFFSSLGGVLILAGCIAAIVSD